MAVQEIALVYIECSFLKNNILSFLDKEINSEEDQRVILREDIKSGAYKFGHCCCALKSLALNRRNLVWLILSMVLIRVDTKVHIRH